MPEQVVKGLPVRLFENRSAAGLSDRAVDCRGANAILVSVFVTGDTPSADITVEGSDAEGGSYLQLPDPNASQTGVTASKTFDVVVGAAFVKVRLSNVSGTFGAGRGFTVIVTPYISPGQSNVTIAATASQNLAEIGGATISLGQKPSASSLPVVVASDQSAVQVDTELPAAGGLADGAANPTAPQVGAAGELFNGSTWDRARSVAASGAGRGVAQVGTLGELITLAASAARTASGNGTPVTGLGWRNRFIVLLDITASQTDAGDTLDVYVDVSLDGTTWLNAIHFTQQPGNGSARKEFAVLDPSNPGTSVVNVTADAAAGAVRPAMFGPQMRARWAIVDAGTPGNSSHTFSVTAFAI